MQKVELSIHLTVKTDPTAHKVWHPRRVCVRLHGGTAYVPAPTSTAFASLDELWPASVPRLVIQSGTRQARLCWASGLPDLPLAFLGQDERLPKATKKLSSGRLG